MSTSIHDVYGRPLHDLRISVTDRCNFRCLYCMPKEVFGRDFEFAPQAQLLTFEELTRLARLFIAIGVEKIRITGGEPLLRRDLPRLVSMLSPLPGLRDLTLTTNGSLLASLARPLREAGLDRITVSLDSLDDEVFRRMNDVSFPVSRVLEGIERAVEVGFAPIKINVVVRRGINDHTVVDMARYFRRPETTLRFIEYMDVGTTNGWQLRDLVPSAEIVERIDREMPLESMSPLYRGEVARRYRYRSGEGEIGLISSVTKPFCGDCTRARLSAVGELYTCLFAAFGRDLRSLVRGSASDSEISSFLQGVWQARTDRYSEVRTAATVQSPKVEMSHIGG